MPKLPVGNKGDYYWVDKLEYLFTFQYIETRRELEALRESGSTIYERMVRRYEGQIPEGYLVLGDDTEWGDEFITIRRCWAHKDHHWFVPASPTESE